MTEANLSAWEISDPELAADSSPRDLFVRAIRYAILAPSSHNSQPWRFCIAGDQMEIYADRTRALAVIDHADRELVISCGAALFTLCLCLRNLGVEPAIKRQPEGRDADPLARVRILGKRATTTDERVLFGAITKRRTTRAAFEARDLSDQLQRALAAAVENEGAWLWRIQTQQQRIALADLIAEADREQWSDPRVRRELAAWMHPNRSASGDGMPGHTVGLSDLVSVVAPVVMRTFDLGGGRAAHDREIALGSPLMAVIGTEADNSKDWLVAGEALMHLLLRATAEGVRVSYLNQPIELAHLRARLREMLVSELYPQLCLRLGFGPVVRPTPRRALDDVLTLV